ncbi:TPR end-of-group domain-containing protein [Rubritalea tangerina]|uniref:TPR end-of-group domain-containing protein n=1 Tax=Rubritalea tangerina TaxID=430798 RepID=A0ABW4Z7A8_9BACT
MNVDRCLQAAEGYLQLEMPGEAMHELVQLPRGVREKFHAKELELAAEMMQKHWNRGADLARELCQLKPHKRAYFLHAAFCLHETGDTLAAKSFLMSGPKSLMKDALFHYNMACYSAVLEDPVEAQRYLRQAFELDPSLRETAKTDKDLVSIAWV